MAIGIPTPIGSAGSTSGFFTITTTTDVAAGNVVFLAIATGSLRDDPAPDILQVNDGTNPFNSGPQSFSSGVTPSIRAASFWQSYPSPLPAGSTLGINVPAGAAVAIAYQLSGLRVSSPRDHVSIANGSTAAVSVSSGTLAQINEIVMVIAAWGSAAGVTLSSISSVTVLTPPTGFAGVRLTVGYDFTNTTAAVSYVATLSDPTTGWAAIADSFRAAPFVSGGIQPMLGM